MRNAFTALLFAFCLSAAAVAQDDGRFTTIETPTLPGAREPFLFSDESGPLVMSWTEDRDGAFEVRLAVLDDGVWSAPVTVVSSPGLFVNWADAPSVTRLGDGTLAVHWLQRSGSGAFDYDVNIAFSSDNGRNWTAPVVPHLDRRQTQHGFVTLVPGDDDLVAVWLDGRAYGGAPLEPVAVADVMQLRAARFGPNETVRPDQPVDLTTCSCCQTAAARAGGDVVVAYRDRTENEIRDISVVWMTADGWSVPAPLHRDGWEIAGCPVNGPAIAARGDDVVVAWFTGADNEPAVKIAFSDDAGRHFDPPARIDLGQPVGRVDALMTETGTALISWVEWEGAAEHLFICEATRAGCLDRERVAINSAGASVNFPKLAATPDGIYLAWTQPLANGEDSVRMVRSDR
jgi:hypothetical protein